MDRVAVAGEGADVEAAAGDGLPEPGPGGSVLEQLGRVAVGVAGVGAAADLDRADAGLLDVIQRLLERSLGKEDHEHADLHGLLPPTRPPRPGSVRPSACRATGR